uniref:ABC transporter domain-containing protein n=1 Tax=Phytophthora ramorum TaxID=164328 RepID=H3GF88_PHYRM
MADASQPTDQVVGTNTHSRNLLLKRNPQLRDTQASSPGFGGLGTRQFVHKQLMTPGSATSASSFEEGASYDGFSDAGTPGTDDGFVQHSNVHVKAEPTEFVTRTGSKQPTKRLSSPSRESLARRLMGTSTNVHGMVPDDESRSKVDMKDGDLPSEMLGNLVVKRVPNLTVAATEPRSTKVTRRIVASPTRKSMRRVVVRRTGADGQVHEEVQYVDAAGQVVRTEGGSFFNEEQGEASTTRRISTPGKTLRRVVIRRTGADGKVHEEVQFMDADGKVVEGDGALAASSSTTSTPTVTRRIVTPAKLTRRILRRTGADGQVHEEVQYLDVDGNVVRTEGGEATSDSLSSSTSGSVVTRTTATPSKKIRRVVVRRTGADGHVHEEVQYLDADGTVVQSDGSELIKTSSVSATGGDAASGRTLVTRRVVSPGQTLRRVLIRRKGPDGEVHEEVQYVDADGNVVSSEGGSLSTEETSTNEGSSDTPGGRKVTRRVIQRMLVGKDGTRVPVEQFVDSDGQVVDAEGGTLVRSESFSSVASDTSTSSRRTITRRVVSSPAKVVRRSVAHKAGSSSGVDSEDEVQYADAEGGDLVSSGSFTRTATSQSTPGRRIITRRVVTPHRVVRRMVVRKGTAGSGAESDVDELDADAEFAQSEGGGSSDESLGGSSRGGMSVSDRIVIPGSRTRRRVYHTAAASNQPEEVEQVVTESIAAPGEKVVASVSASNQSEAATPTRVGVALTTDPEEGSASPEATDFTKAEADDNNASIPTISAVSRSTKTEAGDEEDESPKIGGPALAAGVAGAAVVASAMAEHSSSPEGVEVTAPEEGGYSVSSVEESSKAEENDGPAAGGFWNFFGKSEDNQVKAPSGDDEEPDKPKELIEGQAAPLTSDGSLVAGDTVLEAQQQPSEAEDTNGEPETDAADVIATASTTRTEEESSGGFWGFFGKSEPTNPELSDVAPDAQAVQLTVSPASDEVVESVEDTAPTTAVPTAAVPTSPISPSFAINAEQQEEVGSSGIVTFHEVSASDDSNEDKAPIAAVDAVRGDVVDVPETQATIESQATPKSPRETDGLGAVAVAGAAGAATAAVVSALGDTKPDARPAVQSPKSDSAELPVDDEAVVPVSVVSPNAARPGVAAIQTTALPTTEDESASPSTVPQRKTGRSIWKFWGADKPQSPLTGDGEGKEGGPAAVEQTAVPSAGEARPYWHQQDEQSPTQNSYAAAGGATYGSEATFEQVSAAENEVAPAIVADIAVVTDSQQPVERGSVERQQPKDEKPARAGGFWGFLGKKDRPTQSAAAMAAGGAIDNSSVGSVSWDIEGESTKHEDKAAVGAVVQVESIRRSLPSNGSPTNAAGVAAPTGKPVRDSERRTTELIDGVEPDIELDEHYVEIASPRHGGRAVNEEGEWAVKPCSLAWNKLRLNRKSWKSAPASTALTGSNEAVLDDVSGSLKAREFLVITGPSKDESLALLSCLAGHEDAMEGNVTVNGREWNEKMSRYVAYVMREDLFYETLTVHDHLVIQAQLRMRHTHTDEMCLARVERVIEDMGLSECRDKLIGGGISLRGITRGERKLLAIATALLTNPSILLVEEPTDGLDTFSAEKIVAKLRWLAFDQGLTVAVTLHHPSSHFYGLFDVLYLVADASCVYDGKASDCVAYFSTIGYQCPEYMSPVDYFMLQMVTGDRDTDDEGVARVEMLKREWTERNAAVYADNAARAAVASEDAVVDDYDRKNGYYHMGCCGQLWLLWARHVRRLSRYGFVFWWHLLAALLVGVVFGLVYLQLDLDDQQGIQNFAGAFFYVVVVQMLFIAYRTFVFMPRETAIALRERQEYRGGWYHLLCWYFTKIVAELPALIILSIALFVPVFLLVGIGHGFTVYIYMQIVVVLAGWAAIGLAFLTLGVLRHVTLALIVYAVLLVLFVAFGGLLINVTDIPDWLVWLHYISPVKYAYEALMKIFWKRVDSIDCDWTLEGCYALTGDGVLKYYSMENRSALGDSLILLAICFAVFFVAFWFLLVLANKRISGLQWRYDWSFKGPLGRRQQRVGNATVGEKHGATRSSMQRIIERKSQHSSSAAVERSTAADGDNCYIRVETPRAGGRGVCDAPGITLGWSSLWLKTTIDKKAKVEGETQHLLTDASGNAKCGELVLITGPSEDSNVALLESLGGLQKKLRGKVTLNGVVSSASKVAERAAYVARDDLLYETLTVEEHLRFQAQLVVGKANGGLCCGAGDGDLETERVEMVLDELELTSKRHVLIRYLSASDVKLLSIATVLLTNPSILLAEEPTCGMDFYSSQRVVLKLRQLARGGRTVVVTMAHPSSHLYALFDTLYLLADGVAVYHGKVRAAVPYFASLGYQCPQYMSPVDYFIRQVSVRSSDGETADRHAKLFKEAWSTRYSELCLEDGEQQETQAGAAGHRRRVGCCGQISLLFRRHVLRLARYRAVFGWHAFWMILLGVIFGLIFLQLDLDDQQDIQNWAGAFFFIIVLQMLVIAYRTFVFLPREMAIAEREHRSGGYYMICWYLTKMFAELPAMLVLSVLLFVPAYLLIGIGHGFKLYLYMQLVMWLAGWSAAGMASLLLGLFRRVRVALIVYMLLLILFVVFGGLLINVDDVPDYLIWLHYISPVKYGYEALMKLFWGRIAFLACGGSDGSGSGSATFATVGDDYSFSMSGSGSYEDDDCIAHSGDEVLSHYSMKSRDARSDSIILLELTVLYFFIGYAFLSLRWRRYKSRQQRHSSQNAIDN